MKGSPPREQLLQEIEELRNRLAEVEETLQAIRSGEVDALVVSSPEGDQLFTLKGADYNYRILLETMEEGAATLGPDGTILYGNQRLAVMLKTPLQRVIGVSFHEFLSGTDGESFQKIFGEKKAEAGRKEFLLKAGDGTPVPALISFGRMEFEGMPAVCLTATDLTEQKRAEEELQKSHGELELRAVALEEMNTKLEEEIQERRTAEEKLAQSQKMEAIGVLAGGIAHDFNNLLAVIVTNVELAIMDIPQETRAHFNLQQSFKAALQARDLIKQILTFSRKSPGQEKIISLGNLLKETFTFLRSSIPATIAMDLKLKSDTDLIYADSSQIQQVVVNLCTNAVHAMRRNPGKLEISLGEVSFNSKIHLPDSDMNAGDYLVVSVRDTGHGMTEEIKKRAFDPFFTTKAPGEGTGLGLSVVYGIVKNCKGGIAVESKPGEGSIFKVFFPKSSPEQVTVQQEKSETLPKGTERILFVDDEAMLVNAVTNMLKRLGYQVTAFTGSLEALKAFSERPLEFDMVISDQTMPFMTGEDLAKEIIRIRPDIPVILSTGYSELITEERAKEIGIDGFVLKPFSMHEGANLVRRVLDRKRSGKMT